MKETLQKKVTMVKRMKRMMRVRTRKVLRMTRVRTSKVLKMMRVRTRKVSRSRREGRRTAARQGGGRNTARRIMPWSLGTS